MKPYQILTFLISVFLVLFIMAALLPDNGLKIGDRFSLNFVKPEEFFTEDTVKYADISGIIGNSKAVDEIPTTAVSTVIPEPQASPDTLVHADTIRASADSLKKITHLIELPPANPNLLYPFFRQVSRLGKDRQLVRVLHYGDSQIEADRMTSYIRHKLQVKFGGSGCGMIPVVPLYNGKLSIKQAFSGAWDRYTGFAHRDTTLKHKRYGALFTFSKFRVSDTLKGSTAAVSFSPSPLGYRSSRSFNRFSVFIGGRPENTRMDVFAGDSLIDSLTITPQRMYHEYTWTTPSTPEQFRLTFTGQGSPEIYGITLDNDWGIAVDNIPLRGSSGLVFSKVDTLFLKKMYQDLNVGMILLQFGGNVIPYLTKDYDYYEHLFKRELGVIRRMLPGVPVVVIGPSDMSKKENGKYVTYSNLEPVRDALEKAALESGCAFWDMYEAMGGRNSMPSWVFAEPPLAVSDFVHFNTRGARIVAEMFYNAFIYEYDRWLQNSHHYAENRH
ncbi:MAG TPA: hypothetical protein VE870_16955 [Bacteroidales bacterium]|nr:hypothetical protein [Bacteroidales bacterium]